MCFQQYIQQCSTRLLVHVLSLYLDSPIAVEFWKLCQSSWTSFHPNMPSRPDSHRNTGVGALDIPHLASRRSQSSGRSSPYLTKTRTAAIRDDLLMTVDKVRRQVTVAVRNLTPLQRVIAAVAAVSAGTFGLLFLIYNERIFDWLEPFAEDWKHTTGGWMVLWTMVFFTAFPPLIGYSTCGTIAGFVYGIWEGWFIYATATVAGSFCSFVVSRTVLRRYVERMVASDKRFAALTLTLKEDGLKLLCMIRLCPLPYSLSNGAMSTFPTIEPLQYALATALITPKLFIHVFIGSRLSAIAKKKGEMSAGTKALNWISIIAFAMLGAFVGWLIYQKTMLRARQMEAEEAAAVRNTARRSSMPPREFTDDPEAQAIAVLLAPDDELAYFDDEPDARPYLDSEVEHDDTRDDDEDLSSSQSKQ